MTRRLISLTNNVIENLQEDCRSDKVKQILCFAYHFRLEHELTFIDIQRDVSWNASILHIYTFPIAPFSYLAEFDSRENLWIN